MSLVDEMLSGMKQALAAAVEVNSKVAALQSESSHLHREYDRISEGLESFRRDFRDELRDLDLRLRNLESLFQTTLKESIRAACLAYLERTGKVPEGLFSPDDPTKRLS